MIHRIFVFLAGLSGLIAFTNAGNAADAKPAGGAIKPNVLFISSDDLNDWIGCMGGLAKTPNLDRLAARGTLFTNAHCQSPLCNSSRCSLMIGMRASTTGIYGLAPWFRRVEICKDRVSLPQYFAQHGYKTFQAGKTYHNGTARSELLKEFHVLGPEASVGAKPEKKLVANTPYGNHPLVDWGVFPHNDEDKGDYIVASWGVEQLRAMPKDQPFFMAIGFFLPHVPCYATQKWFDLYPDDDSLLPEVPADDLEDLPRFSEYMHWKLPEPRLAWLKKHNQWRNLVRSYLASTSFMDSQVGRLLDALEETGQADNTIVVFWSDHGWHLGEKHMTAKTTLWDRATKVPLIFAGPGVTAGGKCESPAELLDMYPTLAELAGLPARDDQEGHSLAPQAKDASAPRSWPAITTHNQGNHGIRTTRWRYIQYADGSEELYDMKNDPHEWKNLARDPKYAKALAEHRRWIPDIDAPHAPGSAHRVLTYDPATDGAVWEGQKLTRDMPVPE